MILIIISVRKKRLSDKKLHQNKNQIDFGTIPFFKI